MRKLKSILSVVLSCILFSTTVSAAVPAWTNVNGVFYNDKGEEIKGAIAKGIDVSHHQGAIDWARVKQAGIDFAIIRCGYGDDFESQDDAYFAENVLGCEQNGIAYGIYIFSYAADTTQAESEADHVLRLILEHNAKPSMPIYYDIESNNFNKNLSNTELGDLAETFCNKMIGAGYKVGVYSDYNWWNTKLTDSRFNQWDKWVARYNSSCDYANEYNIWQYTSKGTIDGIEGVSDVNILLSKPCSVKGHTYALGDVSKQAALGQDGVATYKCNICGHVKTGSIPKIGSITLNKTSYAYSGKANKPAITVKDSIGVVLTADNYSVSYSNNKKPGQATVKITFKGKYTGTVTKTFTITPAKVKLSKATNQKGRKVKITWKKAMGASGYEVQYAKNKTFKKGKKTVNAKASAKTKTITKLTKKKTYYIRVRAYKSISGKKVYGAWSKAKHLKVTK